MVTVVLRNASVFSIAYLSHCLASSSVLNTPVSQGDSST